LEEPATFKSIRATARMAKTDLPFSPSEGVVLGGEEHVVESSISGGSPKRSLKKKRGASQLRKAPQAPKRFKSSYICFFMAKQPEIKEELGDRATVTEISKRSAEMWRNLPAEKRAHWDEVAAKDKERYLHEKATYKGPWQVPWKRAKKDPSAPKRPMSAFLYFSQGRRKTIKDQNPEIKNTQVSRLLGEMWRNASEEDRKPYVDKEKKEREKYKVAIADWRKEFEAKKEEQRQQQEAQQSMGWSQAGSYAQEGVDMGNSQIQYSQHHPSYMTPTGYAPYPGAYGYGSPYPPQPMYQFPTNGKQPVILGPNGMPHYHQPNQSQYAPQAQAPIAALDDGQSSAPEATNYDFIPQTAG